MPNCAVCGKPVPKVPVWLNSAKVTFRCNACPGATLGIAPTLPDFDEGEDKVEDAIGEVEIEVESLEALEETEDDEESDDDEV